MAYLEISTLYLSFAGVAQAPARVFDYASSNGTPGRLLACWQPEIGPLNKLLVMRSFDNASDLFAERKKLREQPDPFDCGDVLLGLDMDSFALFQGFAQIEPGGYGPFYEIRTYRVRPGGLARLIPEWADAAPRRSSFSLLLTAAYALDGPSRMMHIWPYHSLESRAEARSDAAKNCAGWPTPSGAAWLDPTDLRNAVYIPCSGSPLY